MHRAQTGAGVAYPQLRYDQETWSLMTFQTNSPGFCSSEYGGKRNSFSLPSCASTKSRTFFER
jgi:hypothetical protein